MKRLLPLLLTIFVFPVTTVQATVTFDETLTGDPESGFQGTNGVQYFYSLNSGATGLINDDTNTGPNGSPALFIGSGTGVVCVTLEGVIEIIPAASPPNMFSDPRGVLPDADGDAFGQDPGFTDGVGGLLVGSSTFTLNGTGTETDDQSALTLLAGGGPTAVGDYMARIGGVVFAVTAPGATPTSADIINPVLTATANPFEYTAEVTLANQDLYFLINDPYVLNNDGFFGATVEAKSTTPPPPGGGEVPEPSTVLVWGLLGIGLVAGRRFCKKRN